MATWPPWVSTGISALFCPTRPRWPLSRLTRNYTFVRIPRIAPQGPLTPSGANLPRRATRHGQPDRESGGRVEDLAHAPGERRGRERLREEVDALRRDPAAHDLVVGVAGRV